MGLPPASSFALSKLKQTEQKECIQFWNRSQNNKQKIQAICCVPHKENLQIVGMFLIVRLSQKRKENSLMATQTFKVRGIQEHCYCSAYKQQV